MMTTAARPFPIPTANDSLSVELGYEAADPGTAQRAEAGLPAAARGSSLAQPRVLPPWPIVVLLTTLSISLLIGLG
jgi:hypothetical protein